jgi:hypothetical protein
VFVTVTGALGQRTKTRRWERGIKRSHFVAADDDSWRIEIASHHLIAPNRIVVWVPTPRSQRTNWVST